MVSLSSSSRHPTPRNRGVRDRRQALTGNVVDHIQNPEALAVGELVMDKTQRPPRTGMHLAQDRGPRPDRPGRAYRCATASRFTAGVTIFLNPVPSSPPDRASAQPAASWLRVLILERLRTRYLRHGHPAGFGPPIVESAFRHAMLPTQIGTLHPCLMLRQDADDLFIRESCSLHCPSSSRAGL